MARAGSKRWVIGQAGQAIETLRRACELERFPVYVEWCCWQGEDADVRARTVLFANFDTTIEFNRDYCRKARRAELCRTICHEVAHCVDFRQRVVAGDVGFFTRVEAAPAPRQTSMLHGRRWRELLRRLGYDPAYYKAD